MRRARQLNSRFQNMTERHNGTLISRVLRRGAWRQLGNRELF